MKKWTRPKGLSIWAEDPLNNKVLGGITISYEIERMGYYLNLANIVRNIACQHGNKLKLGIRKPRIKVKLYDKGPDDCLIFHIPIID